MKLISSDLTKGKYSVVKFGSVLERMQYGTSEKASEIANGIPIIRMNNIIEGKINFNKLKYINLTLKALESLKLKKGDILINRTNSKELVGKCAVFNDDGEYVFASYLIRLNIMESALPDYIAYSINSSICRQQIDAISRQIIGQANINTREIADLDIVLPPLKVQKEIMRHIFEKQKQIQKTEKEITENEQLLKNNIESVIIGHKKVSEL
jgi:type I restriction enzyme S subunit